MKFYIGVSKKEWESQLEKVLSETYGEENEFDKKISHIQIKGRLLNPNPSMFILDSVRISPDLIQEENRSLHQIHYLNLTGHPVVFDDHIQVYENIEELLAYFNEITNVDDNMEDLDSFYSDFTGDEDISFEDEDNDESNEDSEECNVFFSDSGFEQEQQGHELPLEMGELEKESETPKVVEAKMEQGTVIDENEKEDEMLFSGIELKKATSSPSTVQAESNGAPEEQVTKSPSDEYSDRAALIRKQAFLHPTWNQNKTIGVWSPLHRSGVTTFVMNFAIFLAKFRVQTAVLEALNDFQLLKSNLLRFTEQPDSWVSYAQALSNSDISPLSVKWIFQNVHWIPLDYSDHQLDWNVDMLYHYVNSVKHFDILLLDLPTGVMRDYTFEMLNHIDELWIIVDDNYMQYKSWKDYINTLKKDFKKPFYLISNKHETFSRPNELSTELEVPLLATVPSLHLEVAKNNYERTPLINQQAAFEKVKDSYLELSSHLLGKDFVHSQIPVQQRRILSNLIDWVRKK
jgi:hypothetical protein